MPLLVNANALFDALYLLQKNVFYKKLYYLSHVISTIITIHIVLSSKFAWTTESDVSWLMYVLEFISVPVAQISKLTFVVLLAISVGLIGTTCLLLFHVAKNVRIGTMSSHRSTRLLRVGLGLLGVFSQPIWNVFLMSLSCNWLSTPRYASEYWGNASCLSDWFQILVLCISALMVIPFVMCVVVSNIMHINDPRSSIILARAHSRVDLLEALVALFLLAAFMVLKSMGALLVILFLVLQLCCYFAMVIFQPYYQPFTNDLFSSFSACVIWSGISFAVLIGTGDAAGYGAAVMLLAGVLPFGALGFLGSRTWRKRLLKKTLKEYHYPGKNAAEIPNLPNEAVFPVIRGLYDRNITAPVMDDVGAAIVEVKTRFLMYDRSPTALDIAEHILKAGLLKYPQSAYLRLQYVTFLISYRENMNLAAVRMDEFKAVEFDWDLQFSVLRKRRELERKRQATQLGSGAIDMDSISFEEMKKRIRDARELHKKAIEIADNIWRTLYKKLGGGSKKKHHEHHRLNDHDSDEDEETFEIEEGAEVRTMKKQQQQQKKKKKNGARGNNKIHPTTIIIPASEFNDIVPSAAPKLLALQGDDASDDHSNQEENNNNDNKATKISQEAQHAMVSINPLLETLQSCITETDKEYQLLLVQCHDSKDILLDYARYLRNVKHDIAGAEEYEEKASFIGCETKDNMSQEQHSKKEGSSVGHSSVTKSSTTDARRRQHATLTNRETKRVSRLKTQLRIVSLLMVAACTVAFVFYYVESDVVYNVFFSNSERGILRNRCAGIAYDLRSMHVAAMNRDAISFNHTATNVLARVDDARTLQFNLINLYSTGYFPLINYTTTPSINITKRGSGADNANPTTIILVAPEELFRQYLLAAEHAANAPLTNFQRFDPRDPSTFPQFYFVLENMVACGRGMDTAAVMYGMQLNDLANRVYAVLISMCALVIVIELFTVLLVFRPSVTRMFDEFWSMLSRFTDIPLPVIEALGKANAERLNRMKVFAGEDECEDVLMNDGVGNSSSNPPSPGGPAPSISTKLEPGSMNLSSDNCFDRFDTGTPRKASFSRKMRQNVTLYPGANPSPDNLDAASAGSWHPNQVLLDSAEDNITLTASRPPTSATRSASPGAKEFRFGGVQVQSLSPASLIGRHSFRSSDGDDDDNDDDANRDADLNNNHDTAPNKKFVLAPVDKQQQLEQQESATSSTSSTTQKITDETRIEMPKKTLNEDDDKDNNSVMTAATAENKKPSLRAGQKLLRSFKRGAARIFGKFKAAATLEGKETSDGEADMKSNRKVIIILTYYALLFCITVCIITFTVMGYSSLQELTVGAPEINNAGRHKFLLKSSMFWAREVLWTTNSTLSFSNSGNISALPVRNRTQYTLWTDVPTLRTNLRSAAIAALAIHEGLLQGGAMITAYPKTLNMRARLSTDPYSPLTRDTVLFSFADHLPGMSTRSYFVSFLYMPQCLAANDFGPNSFANTHSRMQFLSNTLSDRNCPYFLAGDPATMNGMHGLYSDVGSTLLRLADASILNPATYQADLASVLRFDSDSTDIMSGLAKLLLMSEENALEITSFNQYVMIALYAVAVVVVILQYALLGRKIEALMKANLSIVLIMDGMLLEVISTMKKQGYTEFGKMAALTQSDENMTMKNDFCVHK